MIIDVHTHLAYNKIFPSRFMSEVADSIFPGEKATKTVIEHLVKKSLQDDKANLFIKKMDEAGINKAVLLIADFGIALGEPTLSIEDIFLIHKEVLTIHSDRFIVFGGVDPRRGIKGVQLFEQSVKEYQFKGLKLYPPCGFELDEPTLYPLYEICNQYNLPVLTHTGPSLKSLRTEQKYPSTILKVAEQFKNIKFILGHGGARDCETTLNIVKKRSNVYFDISTFQRFMTSEKELSYWMRRFCDECPDRVLFGTDWPMFVLSISQKQLVNKISEINNISDLEKENIFYNNAVVVLAF